MTGFEMEAAGTVEGSRGRGQSWSQLLAPILAAALVLALGLVLVSLTGDAASEAGPHATTTSSAPSPR